MGRRRTIRSIVGVAVVAAGLVAVPSAALAEEPAVALPTLGEAMTGEVAGLEVEAFTAFETATDGEMLVSVEVANTTGAPAEISVPYGTLLETDVEADQTFGVAGPTDDPAAVAAAQAGEVPTLTAGPGESAFTLTVFCTQRDDGAPFTRTPLEYAGEALEPLPTVLRNIVAQQPDPTVAQDAVWWVTDEPTYPVPDDIAPLLTDVPAAQFAADPHAVVPDEGYQPGWQRAAVLDESFDGGSPASSHPLAGPDGSGNVLAWVLVLLTAAVVVALVVRLGRRRPTPVVAPVVRRAGWYPDPYGAGHRYWDGRMWTHQVMGPR